MPSSSHHQSRCQALDEEVTNLRTIAERLGANLDRFEEFLATQETTTTTAAVDNADTEQCEQLARELQKERKLLIAAWEELEQEQRRLLSEPKRTESTQSVQPAEATSARTPTLPTVMPSQPTSDRSASKRNQFRQLQREIDGRR